MPTLTLLHTNDFHNHLLPEQADRLREARRSIEGQGLLLDAGDAISSGNITYKPAGEPILDMMSDAGYDAMTVGNREFHFSRAGFCVKVRRARFPVLCANVRTKEAGAELPVVPSIRRTLSGVRIIIFGLTVPMITERMLSRTVSAYVFDDPLSIARALVPTLRPECDLLICLSHIGLARDRELAASVPGIDLIIGGHTHATLETGERVEETLIVQAGWWGKYLGTVTMEIDPADTREGGKGKPVLTAKIEPL